MLLKDAAVQQVHASEEGGGWLASFIRLAHFLALIMFLHCYSRPNFESHERTEDTPLYP